VAELLIELLSEEIPARMQARAAADFASQISDRLKTAALDPVSVRSFVTPRRIALVADGVPVRQPNREEERRGPRVGAPDKAIQGFLGAAGLSSLDECQVREVKGAEFYFVVRRIEGQSAESALPEIIAEAIGAIPWPKSMRWADTERRYVRPLERVSVAFDGAPLAGEIDFGGNAGRKTFTAATAGHRFMSGHAPVLLTNFDSYKASLERAFVLLDPAERKAKIESDLQTVAEANGLVVKHDPALLDEVTGLVEWPVVLTGRIDDAFMSVPAEALTTSMRTHQKYFALETSDGVMAPNFAVVANIESKDDGKRIVAGNERVLRARLADARFFWDQDRKVPLSDRLAALEKVVFHAKLGTLADRVRRMQALSRTMANAVDGADAESADKAALLAKADLVSDMVREFPELQGVMGRYYALEEGVEGQIADAIRDHYAPQGPADTCPTQPISIAVALAEKIDTLVGFFAIDEKPTGSRDPYALRRAALGVIRLALENQLALPLRPAFIAAHAGYTGLAEAADADVTACALLQFIGDRLKAHLRGQGVLHHHIAAVFALGDEDDLVRIVGRVEALGDFLASEDGVNLLTAYRRAANIAAIESKKDGQSYNEAPDPAVFEQDEERVLAAVLADVRPTAAASISDGNFGDAMASLARLRQPVDAFFEKVTVNADDKNIRANRLRLLSLIGATMREIADFDQIEG
jgi:glycyl-tRNA synthetase beta chain